MCRKIICIILIALTMLSVFGCAAPNVTDDSIKAGGNVDATENDGKTGEHLSGTIAFYLKAVAEDDLGKEPPENQKQVYELEPSQAQQIADIFFAVEWMNEAVIDRAAGASFDGEIVLNDIDKAVEFGGDLGREQPSEKNNCICYFGYDKELYLRFMPNDKLYYIGYYAPLTDEQMQCIKNMKP